jgi:hypothetical protein
MLPIPTGNIDHWLSDSFQTLAAYSLYIASPLPLGHGPVAGSGLDGHWRLDGLDESDRRNKRLLTRVTVTVVPVTVVPLPHS